MPTMGSFEKSHSIDRNTLVIPEVLVDSFSVYVTQIMFRTLGAIWEANP
jgi:hypothetical protein